MTIKMVSNAAPGTWAGLEMVGFRFKTVTGASVTLQPADVGSLIICSASAAQTLTLPDPVPGGFFLIVNIADVALTIQTAKADTLIGLNDTALDSIDYDESGQLIGAAALVVCTETKWVAINLTGSTHAADFNS